MPNLGPMEILVILVVALVVLGPSRLPEAGRQVGRAFAEMRRWTSGVQSELRDALVVPDEPQPPHASPVTAAPDPAGATDATGGTGAAGASDATAATDHATEAPATPTPGDLAPENRPD